MSASSSFQYRDSGRAGLEDEEEFVDILGERRRSSDISFSLRTFSPQPYRGALSCSTADLNNAVLESQYLRYMTKEVGLGWIRKKRCVEEVSHCRHTGCFFFFFFFCIPQQIAMETGSSVEELREDAQGILEEMSQNLQLGFIRLMAYVLSKVFKRLFSSVLVNMEGLNAVRTRSLLRTVI